MELTAIISELETFTGKFPRDAVEQAIAQQENITPILLATLEKWQNNLEDLSALPEYHLHIYALYLLAQFRETKAYPPIIQFFSAPGELTFDATGDLVTESLGQIIASVCDGNIEPIKSLIENREANEYVRGEALKSLMILVANQVIERESVINYFKELFSEKLEKEQNFIWSKLVIYSAKLYPEKLQPEIENAFESDLIESFFINKKDVQYYLNLGLDQTLEQLQHDCDYSFISNTITEMENWACFQKPKTQKLKSPFAALERLDLVTTKKHSKSKKKAKNKMQKQSRRKNRSKK